METTTTTTKDRFRVPARSLHQPYAGLMALGIKTIETRGHQTTRRGELLIVSTKTLVAEAFTRLRQRFVGEGLLSAGRFDAWCMPKGQALCIVHVDGCRPLEERDEPDSLFYEPGRFAWTTDVSRLQLVQPFHVRGVPGEYKVPRALVRAHPAPGGLLDGACGCLICRGVRLRVLPSGDVVACGCWPF